MIPDPHSGRRASLHERNLRLQHDVDLSHVCLDVVKDISSAGNG